MTDSNGTPKSALRELADFRAVLDAVDIARCTRADTEVGLVVPAHVDSAHPFTDERDQTATLAAIQQAYVTTREAGIPAGIVRESAGITGDCRLYLLPSAKQLTGPGWRRLEALAHAGATVYVSYCPGGTDNQRGPWYAGLNAIFGVRHQLRYGIVDPITTDTVEFTMHRDLGPLTAGTRLEFAAGGNPHQRAFLPVEPVEAEVLATDADGRPALLRRAAGEGALILCTYPLEAMAAAIPQVNPEQTWRLYAALAAHAGVRPAVRAGDPRVLVDCLERADGARFAWFVSQAAEPVAVTPEVAGGATLSDLDTGTPVTTVALPPYGVQVLRVGG